MRTSDDLLAGQIRQMAAIAARSPHNIGAIGDCVAALRLVGRDDLATLLTDATLPLAGLTALDQQSAILADGTPRSTILLGIGEMREVLRLAGTMSPATAEPDGAPGVDALTSLPGRAAPPAVVNGPEDAWLRDALPALVSSLAAALRADEPPAELGDLLDRLRRDVIERGAAAPAIHPEDLGDLAARLAYTVLREGLLRAYDCAFAPLGSASFLHMALRLHPAALGPCFANAGALLSTPDELFDFADAVEPGRSDADRRDATERCAVLLSAGFASSEMRLLAIELGDRGYLRAATFILARIARRPRDHYHPSVAWELRDAAIENADFPLAIAAQRLLAQWRPDQLAEWNVLGQLEATGGDRAVAEAIFVALLGERGDGTVADRLAALREDRFGPFRIVAGFGSRSGIVAARRARADAERGES